MTVADKATDLLAALGGEFIDPPMVLPAAVPLELSGEAVRSRICTFVDGHAQEWALRPDLTLPVAITSASGEDVKTAAIAPPITIAAEAGSPNNPMFPSEDENIPKKMRLIPAMIPMIVARSILACKCPYHTAVFHGFFHNIIGTFSHDVFIA